MEYLELRKFIERFDEPHFLPIEELRELLRQLSKDAPIITGEKLQEIIKQPNFHFLVCLDDSKEDRMIGMACIYFVKLPTGIKGHLGEVVVLNEYRGRGIGEELVKRLIKIAEEFGADFIGLTSHPSRTAANALYEKMGFEKRDTNVYRLRLKQH